MRTELDLIYRCENETRDCTWTTRRFDDIDDHERQAGHWVTGYMEPLNR